MKSLLKSGEFAKLCRTTKETLRHYDKIGLFSPVIRAKNGYNYYAFIQFADFALITALQSAGLSLAEIRAYLLEPSPSSLNDILEEQVYAIERQKLDLEQKQHILQSALKQTQNLQSWFDSSAGQMSEGYRWRIVECPEEYFLETSAQYSQGREDDFINTMLEHVDFSRSQGWISTFQEAYRVEEAHVKPNDYVNGFCAEEPIPELIESDRIRIKPAGRYLQLLNCIDTEMLVKPVNQETLENSIYQSDMSISSVNQSNMYSNFSHQNKAVMGEKHGMACDIANRTFPEEEGWDFASSVDNPMFAAYDALGSLAKSEGITLTGDLYDVVLSLYGGSFKEPIYTEVSRRIKE